MVGLQYSLLTNIIIKMDMGLSRLIGPMLIDYLGNWVHILMLSPNYIFDCPFLIAMLIEGFVSS